MVAHVENLFIRSKDKSNILSLIVTICKINPFVKTLNPSQQGKQKDTKCKFSERQINPQCWVHERLYMKQDPVSEYFFQLLVLKKNNRTTQLNFLYLMSF